MMRDEYTLYVKNETSFVVFIDEIDPFLCEQLAAPETDDAKPLAPSIALLSGQRAHGLFRAESEQSCWVQVRLRYEVGPPPFTPPFTVQNGVTFDWSFGSSGRDDLPPWVKSSVVIGEAGLLTATIDPSPSFRLASGEWLVSMAIRERSWLERLAICLTCQ